MPTILSAVPNDSMPVADAIASRTCGFGCPIGNVIAVEIAAAKLQAFLRVSPALVTEQIVRRARVSLHSGDPPTARQNAGSDHRIGGAVVCAVHSAEGCSVTLK